MNCLGFGIKLHESQDCTDGLRYCETITIDLRAKIRVAVSLPELDCRCKHAESVVLFVQSTLLELSLNAFVHPDLSQSRLL